MIFLLHHLAMFIASMFALWLFFVNVMTWKHYEERIPKFIKPVLYGIAVAGYLFDIVFNVIYGTIIFLRVPHYHRLTLSARLAHILVVETPSSWRWKLAYVFCTKLIEPWDPNHCGLRDRAGK